MLLCFFFCSLHLHLRLHLHLMISDSNHKKGLFLFVFNKNVIFLVSEKSNMWIIGKRSLFSVSALCLAGWVERTYLFISINITLTFSSKGFFAPYLGYLYLTVHITWFLFKRKTYFPLVTYITRYIVMQFKIEK